MSQDMGGTPVTHEDTQGTPRDTWGVSWQDGKETVMKEVFPGDSVHSLLSILDVITVPPMSPRPWGLSPNPPDLQG